MNRKRCISNPCINSTNYLRLLSEQFSANDSFARVFSIMYRHKHLVFIPQLISVSLTSSKKMEAFCRWRWHSPFAFVLIDATFMKYRLYITWLVTQVDVKERPLVCFDLLLVVVFPRLCYVSLKKELSSYILPESCCSKNHR